MTKDETRHWLEIELKTWEDECKSEHPIKEALRNAIKALEENTVSELMEIVSDVIKYEKE